MRAAPETTRPTAAGSNQRAGVPGYPPAVVDEAALRRLFARWRSACVDALAEAREEIDALNVYPVPDADTGTNVFLTLEAAAAAADEVDDRDGSLAEAVRAYVDGALRGARGNSGVIVSQLLRAGLLPLTASPLHGDVDLTDPGWGTLLAAALDAAATAAWEAVGEPVEGTILSVARAAADGAGSVDAAATGAVVVSAAAAAARTALERTPEQLDRLRRAGVVDAGGRALVVVLDTTERVMTGRRSNAGPRSRRPVPVPVPEDDLLAGGPAYEVMYLLDAADDAVPALRRALAPLGDSLVVVGGDGLWNVHVHVDDAGAAVEAGIVAGRPHRVVVTHFAEQIDRQRREARASRGRTVLATAAGPGLAALFRDAGAGVVEPTEGARASTGDLLAAILGSGADEVVLLPNQQRVVGPAAAAARQARAHGVRVAVIPTRAQVQGLAALAVHEPGRGFDDDVVEMTAAAGHTRHGAVTVATGRAMTSAGPCEPGDVLGVVDGDFQVIGSDVAEVAARVLDRLLVGGAELVTLVSGADIDDAAVPRLEAHVRDTRPEVDVVVLVGGQQGYPLFVAVE